MHSLPVIDSNALDAIRSLQQPGSEDLVAKIVSMFLEDVDRYREDIRAAVIAADPDGLGVAAHSLKSCAANVGAMQVSALAADLESQGRQGVLDDAQSKFDALSAAIDAASRELKSQGSAA